MPSTKFHYTNRPIKALAPGRYEESAAQRDWADIQPNPNTGAIDVSSITPDEIQQAIKGNNKDLQTAK